uniref:Uncharacterized protein n=1 Tax=Meloidogyne enterolobii TaxID=390850 RepID=A0A6V7X099_MELEN|nr:unnamed protein product [Meloidogyne enterolobii]
MNNSQCIAAEESVLDTGCNTVRVLHIIFGLIIVIMLIKVIYSYKTMSLNLHKNLLILMSNVFILYLIFALSHISSAFLNFIVIFTYINPCDCLTQVWLVYLILMPAYIYNAGSPLFHFAIMIERLLATVYVKIYEKKGKIFGVISTIIVVIFNG